jgi:response regulator RpfG family c-di-GMP phosphodiesterase
VVIEKSGENDELIFAEEELDTGQARPELNWKVMIVDDEVEIHNVTRLVLDGFQFAGKGLEFVSAYSAAEAKRLLQEHPDTAMLLLDVVMEDTEAGLKLARYIRDELRNRTVRIVLRTGQPGQAPEERVILEYDINDYKSKTELTAAKLFTTVVASLRAYRDIKTLETNKRGLETILKASASIFEARAIEQFSTGVLTQLISLLHLEEDALYAKASGFAAARTGETFKILSGTGSYSECVDLPVEQVASEDVMAVLQQARTQKRELFLDDNRYVGYFCSENGSENLLYLQGWQQLSEWDRYLLEIFCANVAIAYDNISLNNEILSTQREVIFKLGEVVETRNRETGNHVKRVAEYSAILGRGAGLSNEQITVLRFASPMHDLGKMSIPDSVLNKQGPLTAEEFKLMQAHTTVGYEMLRHSGRELLQAAAIVALHHHEKYDGSGYPQGLSGEEIHVYGRITAVADVFDALGVKRVYKEAWPLEKILDYFRAERGKHFDPELVDVFFANLDELLQVRDTFPDVVG